MWAGLGYYRRARFLLEVLSLLIANNMSYLLFYFRYSFTLVFDNGINRVISFIRLIGGRRRLHLVLSNNMRLITHGVSGSLLTLQQVTHLELQIFYLPRKGVR